MTLLSTTLTSGLESMEPTDDETTAIDNFASAWEDYFSDASVAGVVTTPGTLTAAVTALKGGMTGVSNGDAATLIQSAITTFWAVVGGSAATIWVTAPPVLSVTPPPGLTGIAAALTAVFAANTSGELDLAACADAVAAALHTTQTGGIAAQGPPPTSGPIT